MPSVRLEEFDTWKAGYGLASVSVLVAGTTVLAPIFLDEACTQVALNPQTLLNDPVGGINYGKWSAPLYTETPYYLSINDVDTTGIVNPPIVTLEGENASLATVIPSNTVVAGNLDDLLARRIDVRDFGIFIAANQPNASAITNTTTLAAAVARAGALNGGYVALPSGTYQFTSLTLPTGVKLRGVAKGATILQSTQNGAVITLDGQDAGLESMTLDGVNQVTGSIGIFAANIDFVHLLDAMVQRFDIGIQRYGGTGSHWKDLFVSDCSTAGYQPHGYSDNGVGGAITNEWWEGGKVELCIGIGIDLQFVDSAISGLTFSGIGFDSNTGTAFQCLGGQQIKLDEGCWWNGNTVDLLVDDAGSVSTAFQPTQGFEVHDSSFNAAIAPVLASGSTAAQPATNSVITLNNTLAAVAFRRVDFSYTNIDLNSPGNNVLAQDCNEITGVALGGNSPTSWLRSFTFNRGETAGLTTTNAATTGWAITLDPGQRVYVEGKIVGRARNTIDYGFWHIAVSAQRPGSTLNYVNATGSFSAGNVVTGQTSGATARITAITASGTSGTLTLQDINGTFLNSEIIKDTGTGSANGSGTTVGQNAVLIGSVTAIRPAQDSDTNWNATFAVSGAQLQLQVTGDTGYNVEFQVDVDLVTLG